MPATSNHTMTIEVENHHDEGQHAHVLHHAFQALESALLRLEDVAEEMDVPAFRDRAGEEYATLENTYRKLQKDHTGLQTEAAALREQQSLADKRIKAISKQIDVLIARIEELLSE